MPVDAEQYIEACEKAYRDGFVAGQHAGMGTVIVGWADTRDALCKRLEAKSRMCEQLDKSLEYATKDLGAAIRKRDRAMFLRDVYGFLCIVLAVVLIVSMFMGSK